MKPNPNWKKIAEQWEEKYLKVLTERNHAQADLAARPTLEKIVEKEVLPWWVQPLWFSALALWVYLLLWDDCQFVKLSKPILQPYPVYINRVSENRSPTQGRVVTVREMQSVMDKSHRKRVRTRPRLTDCPPGFEAVGGACAQVTAPAGQEIPKDQLGYPAQ